MADYDQPDVVEKRVRFFDGQFLQDQDFIDEQKYHLDRERRLSRLLRVTGIAQGLTVTSSGTNQVTVLPGMAVDALGRQLVLGSGLDLRLPAAFVNKQGIDVHIVYQETAVDMAVSGGKSERRWSENPKIAAVAPDGTVAVAPEGASTTWDGPTVLLARLGLDANGTVTVEGSVAQYAGQSLLGSVGIGTTDPRAKLEVAGAGGTSVDLIVNGRLRSDNNDGGLWIASDRFVGGHSTNRMGFFNGGAWQLTVLSNGNVGIGTIDPGRYRLQVQGGDTGLGGALAVVGATSLANSLSVAGATTLGGALTVGGAVSVKGPASLSSGLTVNGSAGIGTANPGAKLEVAGGGGASVDLLVNGRLRSNSDDGGLWIASDRFVGGHSTNQIGLWNGNAFQLTVLANGNVGIGTTSPAAKLQVAGAGGGSIDLTVNGRLQSNNNDGGLWIAADRFVGGHSTDQVGLYNGGDWRLTVLKNGNIGLGTISPENAEGWNKVLDMLGSTSTKLSVRTAVVDARVMAHDIGYWDSPAGMIAGTRTGHPLSLATSGTARLTIAANGNLGIGVTDPGSSRLRVRGGSTYLEGDLFVGGSLNYFWGPDGGWKQIQNRAGDMAGSYGTSSTPSDARLKTALTPIGHALKKVTQLQGLRYRWSESGLEYFTQHIAETVSAGPDASDQEHQLSRQAEQARVRQALSGEQIGLVAQEVEEVVPEVVHEDADGYKHISYQHLVALLIEAIKEQDTMVRALSDRVGSVAEA